MRFAFVSFTLILLLLNGCATLDKIFEDNREFGIKATKESREEYVKNHPELSELIKGDILKGSVRQGMTTEQVIASWGKPDLTQDVDDVIMFSYDVETPESSISPFKGKKGFTLFFHKRSILKGTPEYLYMWFPPDIDIVYKNSE